MPSTNGKKRAILYARVSTQEQATTGYSLRQQIERLREYAATEGCEVLEEVTDPGYSGASLARPGMDRVRDLVAAGGVFVVLAQDRDRFSREPAYTYLLKREFEEHGTQLRSLNDRGDGSPEGELTDGILDQLAKFERAKLTERSRRGKLRKAREGKVVTPTAKYGFRFNEARDGLVVHEPEMAVIAQIFKLAAEGCGVGKIQSRLYAQSIPSPRGKHFWDKPVLRRIVASDIYRPLTALEVSGLVSAETAARLAPEKLYGIQWFNRHKVTTRTVSVPERGGGRAYKKRRTSVLRPREEWVAVPVPASGLLTKDLVDTARSIMDASQGHERKHLTREWELRGVFRCSCGVMMHTKTTQPNKTKKYHYYFCSRRNKLRYMCDCREPAIQAKDAEPVIWDFVSGLLKDPERIAAGMERLIDQERAAGRGDPEQDARTWGEKLAECGRLRAAYQNQQAAGLMTLEELGGKLKDLEDTRRLAEREVAALKDSKQRVEDLEADRDALLSSLAASVPEALDALTGAGRNKVYRMLRLQVAPTVGGFKVQGALHGVLQNETDTLEEVPGIGPATIKQIEPFATI